MNTGQCEGLVQRGAVSKYEENLLTDKEFKASVIFLDRMAEGLTEGNFKNYVPPFGGIKV